MDPWVFFAAWGWMVPVTGSVMALGYLGYRRRGRINGRRLGYDAARLELRQAEQTARQRSMAAKVARADLARVTAERRAERATPQQVAEARQAVRRRDHDARAAAADVRAHRARVSAARAEIPAASGPDPLERLHTQHDAVTARWMEYETDPARAIAYPAMSDGRSEASAAYFRAAAHANELRRTLGERPTPPQFGAYRNAVDGLENAFEAAERAAKLQAGERPPGPAWQEATKDALTRAADDIAAAVERWTRRDRGDRGDR